METLRAIETAAAPKPVGPYSQAVVCGSLVFTAGQIPLDPATGKLVEGEIEVQAERVLRNLAAVLEAAGTSLSRAVRTTVYLSDLALFGRMNAVYARHFTGQPLPARTTIQAGALPAGALVEIEVVAAL